MSYRRQAWGALTKALGGAMSIVMATTRATARALHTAVTLILYVGRFAFVSRCDGCIDLENEKALDHYWPLSRSSSEWDLSSKRRFYMRAT